MAHFGPLEGCMRCRMRLASMHTSPQAFRQAIEVFTLCISSGTCLDISDEYCELVVYHKNTHCRHSISALFIWTWVILGLHSL